MYVIGYTTSESQVEDDINTLLTNKINVVIGLGNENIAGSIMD